MEQKTNIVLIGMPGVGKSTIGVILAKVLGYSFLDADLLIQEQEGKLLREIIEEKGTDGFIEVENRVNASIRADRAIIATGGSVVYGKEAMEHLKEIGRVVYLKVSYAILEKRLADIKGRGVVLKKGQTLETLFEERSKLYEQYADIEVSEEGLDESRMRKLVRDFLVREGYEVLEAGDGEEALDLFYREKDIALIILDVMMPKRNGFEVCREIRETSKVPIIMLTAKGEESDELNGFELGVDEYISKPFSPKILVARVGAILRRSGKTQDEEAAVSMGGIVLDKAAHMVTVDGERIDLSYKEFELLAYFMENAGIALSREKILNSVWNYDYFGDARTIDTHVKKLRAKMGDKGKYITTVWGMGYKFEVTEE